ncbi:MAG: hypothetical protein ACYDCC_09650 [Actinomycetota bacterium]
MIVAIVAAAPPLNPSTLTPQFWVDVAVAFGTIAAVIVALFGPGLRAWLVPPRLSIRLVSSEGWATPMLDPQGNEQKGMYFFVQASNARRWSSAIGVRILLLQVEEAEPGDSFMVTWTGEIPLSWRYKEIHPLDRVVGPDASVDLCSVGEHGDLLLHLVITPYNLPLQRRGPTNLILTLQAKGNNAESPTLRIKISWDGRWHAGIKEMQRNLKIEALK